MTDTLPTRAADEALSASHGSDDEALEVFRHLRRTYERRLRRYFHRPRVARAMRLEDD